jgi:hypothetical protein
MGEDERATLHYSFFCCELERADANQEAGPALIKTGPVSSRAVAAEKDKDTN